MIIPVKNATIEDTSTAAADTSLINFIRWSKSFETISANFSMDVLNSSAVHTKPATMIRAISSVSLT